MLPQKFADGKPVFPVWNLACGRLSDGAGRLPVGLGEVSRDDARAFVVVERPALAAFPLAAVACR